VVLDLNLDSSDGAGISWLHRNAEVLSKDFGPDGRLAVTVRVDPANAGAVRAKFGAPPS
jgi:GTP-binding protein HflX